MIELVIGGARSGKSRFAENRISELAKSPLNGQPRDDVNTQPALASVEVTYIATGQAHDAEMASRIKRHQNDRSASPLNWQLIEEPTALANTLSRFIDEQAEHDATSAISDLPVQLILVDCLTLWLTNCLCAPITIEDAIHDNNDAKNEAKVETKLETMGERERESESSTFTINVNFYQTQKHKLLTVLSQLSTQANIHVVLVSNEVGHGIVPLGELSREFVDQSGWLHQDIAALASKVDFVMAGIAMNLKNTQVTPS